MTVCDDKLDVLFQSAEHTRTHQLVIELYGFILFTIGGTGVLESISVFASVAKQDEREAEHELNEISFDQLENVRAVKPDENMASYPTHRAMV